jgi:predicted RNase H-like HicB family nuclease
MAELAMTSETLMNNIYTALVKQDGDWWIGWIEEVPGVNCQEKTRGELLETLRITLREALEFNRGEAINAAGTNYDEELIGV